MPSVVCAVAGRKRAQTSIWVRVESPREPMFERLGGGYYQSVQLVGGLGSGFEGGAANYPQHPGGFYRSVAALLGRAVASPLRAARAAASASVKSSLPRRRRS